jgi:hypothetical protein
MPIQKRLCHAHSPRRARPTHIRGSSEHTSERERTLTPVRAAPKHSLRQDLARSKSPPALNEQSPTVQLPARCADAEIRHLEAVIRHVAGAHGPSIPAYLPQSYWLIRLERIERKTCLIPAQQQRIKALRRLLLESEPHECQCA